MSKYLLAAAAVVAFAACGEKKADMPAADTAAVVAPAPTAPATTDSTAMSHDSTMMAGDSAKAH